LLINEHTYPSSRNLKPAPKEDHQIANRKSFLDDDCYLEALQSLP